MNLREIFIETKEVCKKNSSIFLGFTLAIFAVFFAFIVGYMFVGVEWSFLIIGATIAVILPMFVGIDFISKKAVNGEEVEYQDFYLGHRNFLTSLTLETKVLSRGLLFAAIGSFASMFILNFFLTYYIMMSNPEIMQMVEEIISGKTSYMDLANALVNISYYETVVIIIDVTSLFIGAIFYIWQGKRYSFLPYICFETRFNLQTAVYLSKESSESIKKSFFAYNLIYLLIVVVAGALGVGAFYLFKLFLTETVSLVISFFIVCLILSPVFLRYKVSLYVIYAKNFKSRIDETFKLKLEEAKQKSNNI